MNPQLCRNGNFGRIPRGIIGKGLLPKGPNAIKIAVTIWSDFNP